MLILDLRLLAILYKTNDNLTFTCAYEWCKFEHSTYNHTATCFHKFSFPTVYSLLFSFHYLLSLALTPMRTFIYNNNRILIYIIIYITLTCTKRYGYGRNNLPCTIHTISLNTINIFAVVIIVIIVSERWTLGLVSGWIWNLPHTTLSSVAQYRWPCPVNWICRKLCMTYDGISCLIVACLWNICLHMTQKTETLMA